MTAGAPTLFSPLTLPSTAILPMAMPLTEDVLPTDFHRAHLGKLAKGGVRANRMRLAVEGARAICAALPAPPRARIRTWRAEPALMTKALDLIRAPDMTEAPLQSGSAGIIVLGRQMLFNPF